MGSYYPTDSSFYTRRRRSSQSRSHRFPHPQNGGMQMDHQEPHHGHPYRTGRRPDPDDYNGGYAPAARGREYRSNRSASTTWDSHYGHGVAATDEPTVHYPYGYGRSSTVASVPPPPPPPPPSSLSSDSPHANTLSSSSNSLPPSRPLSASSHSLPPLRPYPIFSGNELWEIVQRQCVRDVRDYLTVVGLCRSEEKLSRATVEHLLASSNTFFFQQEDQEAPVVEEGKNVRIKWHTVKMKIAEVELVEEITNPPDSTVANPTIREGRDNEREDRAQRKRQMEMEEEEKRKSEEEKKKKKRVETADTVRQNPVPVVVEPHHYIAVGFVKSEVFEENADENGRGGEKQ